MVQRGEVLRGAPSAGDTESLEEAKVAFRAKFNAWLTWAKELQHAVTWHQGLGKVE